MTRVIDGPVGSLHPSTVIAIAMYLNHHFPNDNPTVLRVAYSEIDWARAHQLRRYTPGVTRGEDWNQRLRYLEF